MTTRPQPGTTPVDIEATRGRVNRIPKFRKARASAPYAYSEYIQSIVDCLLVKKSHKVIPPLVVVNIIILDLLISQDANVSGDHLGLLTLRPHQWLLLRGSYRALVLFDTNSVVDNFTFTETRNFKLSTVKDSGTKKQ